MVKVCTVIGFPLGASATATKVFEAENAIKAGAQEVGLGRRESVADVARVVSRMVDAVVLRTNAH